MNLWIWKPAWPAFGDLERQMTRLMDLTLSVVERQMAAPRLQPFPTGNIAMNFYETSGEYLILLPMPGVKAEELDVQVVGNTVTLAGERARPEPVADELYRRQERWQGRWSRVIQLPARTDPAGVAASLEHGMLLVRIPKVAEPPPRQFPVPVRATHKPDHMTATHGTPTAAPADAARNGSHEV
jgi:HSP20 family protein